MWSVCPQTDLVEEGCSDTDSHGGGPRGHCAGWNKPVTKGQIRLESLTRRTGAVTFTGTERGWWAPGLREERGRPWEQCVSLGRGESSRDMGLLYEPVSAVISPNSAYKRLRRTFRVP